MYTNVLEEHKYQAVIRKIPDLALHDVGMLSSHVIIEDEELRHMQ
jgi:hypothetical protein